MLQVAKGLFMGKLAIFFQKNWFKIAVAVLLLYLSVKKEVRLQMNMHTPSGQPAEAPAKAGRFRERFTELLIGTKAVQGPLPGAEQLDFQPFKKEGDFSGVRALAAIAPPMREAFIQRFGRVAKAEQEKFGIPASIVLGNALLISKSGESMQVKLGLNFFGLICSDDWKGEKGEIEGQCYRYYESAWMSFRDHSLFLTTGKFSGMRELKNAGYTEWAEALEEAGYHPFPNYSAQVLRVIREYQLEKWDQP